MKKCILGLLLIVAIVAVSCTNDMVQDDTILVYFGTLKAKAVDTTAYDISGTFNSIKSNIEIGDVNDYYWQYKATKADNLFQTGQMTSWTNCTSDDTAGLGEAKEFARGAWTFELRAFSSVEDRTSAKANTKSNAVFTGTITTESLTSNTSINVPMEYNYEYDDGTGTVTFKITTRISQDSISGISEYKVTKVEACILKAGYDKATTTTIELEKGTEGSYMASTDWTGTGTGISADSYAVTFKFYLDNGETASITNTAYAVVLPGLTTSISEMATIRLSKGSVQVSLAATLPESQPTLQVNDVIAMGSYMSSDTKYDMLWNVLAVKDNKALVLAKAQTYGGFGEHYFDDTNSTTQWGESSLKTYLNSSTFLETYGLTNVSIVDAEEGEAGYGAGTVFLLSQVEFEEYCTTTGLKAGGSPCLLRDDLCYRSEYDSGNTLAATLVNYQGTVIRGSATSDWNIRPAFWISI